MLNRFLIHRISGLFMAWVLVLPLFSQDDTPPKDWFHRDLASQQYAGVSSFQAYELLKGRTSRTVVVAVIDSGVDIEHEDLKEVIWVNEDEIPNNGIDDDNNGYVDDIHGWNFIGGKDGSHINQDALEMTRIVAAWSTKFQNADPKKLTKEDRNRYEVYQAARKELMETREKAEKNLATYTVLDESLQLVIEAGQKQGLSKVTGKNTSQIDAAGDEELSSSIEMVKMITADDPEVELSSIREELKGALDYFNNSLNYHLNTAFDPRSIVGDDYGNSNERIYGNNDVIGPDATHGTHVAGIIAAQRGNGIGMDGIADNVRIMVIRCVPDGDERDKDVANSIRYAADNGAHIINMSFGKGYAWDKEAVDEAVKYAEAKGVLLIHAAGNESQNVDEEVRYPTRYYDRGGKAKTWMEIGALSWMAAPRQVGSFSNYGKKTVDLFSPGVAIYSTVPGSAYESLQGTSMAAPAAAGVAAVIMSYFPDFSAKDVRKILEKSAITTKEEVRIPGSKETTTFDKLSKTGGRINLLEAVKLATEKS